MGNVAVYSYTLPFFNGHETPLSIQAFGFEIGNGISIPKITPWTTVVTVTSSLSVVFFLI